ncbi:MAG TPA: TonB-dependent receptor plug domain-containing protein, partial [Bacteroidota bacterium]|nr:TonB-dependent receptor plug domain-containing protein [Bacteroidota bacterium]
MPRMNFQYGLAVVVMVTMVLATGNAGGQTIHGRVVGTDSVAVANVLVSIPAIGRNTSTDPDGMFFIGNLTPGEYLVQFSRIGYDKTSATVAVTGRTGDNPLHVVMNANTIALNSITVTAQPQPMEVLNSSQSVSVLSESALSANAGSSPSSALDDVPGISLVHSGDFSEKPEIRGLGYQRVVILEDGIRHEYQAWDDDDSPGIDALSLKRIEVVRGPTSVLYGSDALGGVINYIHNDGTLPQRLTSAMEGELTFQGMSNNTEGAVHASVQGTTPVAEYTLYATARGAGNIETPYGSLTNTGARELNFGLSGSTQRSWGSLLLGYSRFAQHRQILAESDDNGTDEETAKPYQSTTYNRGWIAFRTRPSSTSLSVDAVLQQNEGSEFADEDASSPINNLRQRAASLDVKYYCDSLQNNSATIGLSLNGV